MEVHATDASFQVHHQWQPARDAQTMVFLVSVSDTTAYNILVITISKQQVFGVLCDTRVPQKLKGKFYRLRFDRPFCME
jgi:hypothetical protein